MIAGELARRYADKISSVAFDPWFIIDKSDPELKKRWPKGFLGFFWRVLVVLISKPPEVAGKPIADLMISFAVGIPHNEDFVRNDKNKAIFIFHGAA